MKGDSQMMKKWRNEQQREEGRGGQPSIQYIILHQQAVNIDKQEQNKNASSLELSLNSKK